MVPSAVTTSKKLSRDCKEARKKVTFRGAQKQKFRKNKLKKKICRKCLQNRYFTETVHFEEKIENNQIVHNFASKSLLKPSLNISDHNERRFFFIPLPQDFDQWRSKLISPPDSIALDVCADYLIFLRQLS